MDHTSSRQKLMGVLAAVLLAAASVALAVRFGPPAPPAEEDPGPANLAFSEGPDLDGDGRAETISAGPQGAVVTAGSGPALLRFEEPVTGPGQVVRLGGQHPVLFVQTRPGEYAAFAYRPGTGVMEALAWPDGRIRGYGELTGEGQLSLTVVGALPRTRTVHLRLNQDRLVATGIVRTPAPASPAETLEAALEAAALGVEHEMGLHFADQTVAKAFLAQWHGKLPAGAVRVAQADQVDAGAEEGHAVPVTIWIAGTDEVAALKGDARFTPAPGGRMQIAAAGLDQAPLKVSNWTEAEARLDAARPTGGRAERTTAPFYGTFRFTAGASRFAVDAVTGEVTDE